MYTEKEYDEVMDDIDFLSVRIPRFSGNSMVFGTSMFQPARYLYLKEMTDGHIHAFIEALQGELELREMNI